MSDKGESERAASQLSAAVAGSLLPLSCMYGCTMGLAWVLGGAVIGSIIVAILRHH